MAKAKVKNIKKFTQTFIKSFKGKLKQNISKAKKTDIENEIVLTILNGQSPVKGKKFVEYSENYANKYKGGAVKPVNMYLNGDMLDSLEVKQTRGTNGLTIIFNDEKADWHDSGLGNLPVRRLLPDPSKGETFKDNIKKEIDKLIKSAIKKSTK